MKKIALIIVLFISIGALQSFKLLTCTYTAPTVSNAILKFDFSNGNGTIQAKCPCGAVLTNIFKFSEGTAAGSISNSVVHHGCPKAASSVSSSSAGDFTFTCGAKWAKPDCK